MIRTEYVEMDTDLETPYQADLLPSDISVTAIAPARWRIVGTRPAQMGSSLLLGGVLLWGPLAGGTAAGPPVRQPAQLRYIGEWTSTASTVLTRGNDVRDITVGKRSPELVTDQESVHWLHRESGLTWDQIGRVFGVSRRAVHLWANGGRMNAANSELLADLVATVRQLPAANPATRRAALLATGRDGRSLLDEIRTRNAGQVLVGGSGFSPEQLLGARHDRPESV